MTEKRFNIEFDGHQYFLVIDEDNERCLARLDTKHDAEVCLEFIQMFETEKQSLQKIILGLNDIDGYLDSAILDGAISKIARILNVEYE